ncbi:MAG: hypothetical protein K0R41_4624 [Geminicoccaceae bacterium]|jgi:hypothetical protein|nr:hypothetical protein [Geminicoccaceae bacterium]
MISASDSHSPIPCHIDVHFPAALYVSIDTANRVIVLRLATEEDARL